MRNKTSIFIVATIFFGVILLYTISLVFLSSIKTYYSYGADTEKVEVIIKRISEEAKVEIDTIKTKEVVQKISVLNQQKEGENRLKNTLILNLHPKTLIFLAYYTIFITGSILMSLIMLVIVRRMFYEFKIKITSKEIRWQVLFFFIIIIISFLFIVIVIELLSEAPKLLTGVGIMRYFDIIFYDPLLTRKAITLATTILLSILLTGIAFINVIVSRINDFETNKEIQLSSLKSYLNLLAFCTALIIAGSIIGESLQRDMISEYLTNFELLYPIEIIAVNGTILSFLLAIFFLPTLFYIKFCEMEISLEKDPKKSKNSWLVIGKETIKELEIVFSIFLPLLVSLIDYFIKSNI